MTQFSDREYLRYTRHIQLPKVGPEGQGQLKKAHVLIVGCGGLGAPVSLYLAAAGVGTITLVDGDTVDLTNLQRQVTYAEDDVGKAKTHCTQQRLQQLNSDIVINAVNQHLSPDNAAALIAMADLVLDCSDNFAARYLINDLCKTHRKPWIYASIYQFSGQCALFTPDSSCFRCVFPSAPEDSPDCNAAGVLGVLPGLMGTLQATEALKLLLGLPSAISDKLMLVETDDMSFQKILLRQDEHCPCCDRGFIFDAGCNDYLAECASPVSEPNTINAAEFKTNISRNDIVLIDVREAHERRAFHLGGQHIPLASLLATLRDTHAMTDEKTLILYCQSGARSATGRDILVEHGYKAMSVSGGIAQILRY